MQYPKLLTADENRSMRIAEITFLALIDDVRNFVSEGVRMDISTRISEAATRDEKVARTKYGEIREKNLKQWLAMDYPLSYGLLGELQTYTFLLNAVMPSEDKLLPGLPNLTEHARTQSDFINFLIDVSAPSSRVSAAAPIIKGGAFFPVLKEATSHLLRISNDSDSNNRAFIHRFFLHAIDDLRIKFVPSHPARSGGAGAPSKNPIFDSWAQLGLPESRPSRQTLSHAQRPTAAQKASGMALERALETDSNAEWTLRGLTLTNLHTILRRTRLPSDFKWVPTGKGDYVDRTYKFVTDEYDGTKPAHHLALVVGIIAGSFLPYIFLPTSVVRNDFVDATTRDAVRDVYNSIPWEEKLYKKGVSDKPIYISMFATFAIALYEESSPLREHMNTTAKKGLGNPWTTKHSKL